METLKSPFQTHEKSHLKPRKNNHWLKVKPPIYIYIYTYIHIFFMVWNIFYFPINIGCIIIPIDVHIFQRGCPTTNQVCITCIVNWCKVSCSSFLSPQTSVWLRKSCPEFNGCYPLRGACSPGTWTTFNQDIRKNSYAAMC